LLHLGDELGYSGGKGRKTSIKGSVEVGSIWRVWQLMKPGTFRGVPSKSDY